MYQKEAQYFFATKCYVINNKKIIQNTAIINVQLTIKLANYMVIKQQYQFAYGCDKQNHPTLLPEVGVGVGDQQ